MKAAIILLLLPQFDTFHTFVPDYMHCVLLGVVRQFINLQTDSCSHSQTFHIKNIHAIDRLMRNIKIRAKIQRELVIHCDL